MIVLFLLGAALASAATKADVPAPANGKAVASYGKLPLHFEPNQGQWDSKVRFASRGPNFGLFLSDTEALMVLHQRNEPKTGPVVGGIKPEAELRQETIRMQLLGSSANPRWSGEQKLQGVTNYYLSGGSAGQLGVPHFGSARANGVYDGVDVRYYSQNRTLEYDFVVHPGADPAQIRMRWTGAGKVEVNANGDLVLATAIGEVVHQKPVVYQTIGEKRVSVDGKFRLHGDIVQFALGNYDRDRDLVIDPVVRSYSTLLGGTSLDQAVTIAADSSGNAFVGGSTQSPSFPGNAASRSGTSDAFVTKLNSDGSAILFTTYISGSSTEQVQGVAVDSAGNVYGIGRTQSSNLSGESLGTSFAGGSFDVFLFKLGSTGTITYLRYLGGAGDDFGATVAVSSTFELYFIGSSNSTNLPGAGTAPTGSSYNAFVGKLNSSGGVSYLRYFGGTADDFGLGIAVDAAGAAYIGGSTSSSGLPITSPIRSYSASVDGYIAKIDPTGANVVWGTFIGGSVIDEVYAVALDGAGNVYGGGYTGSNNFPILNTGRSIVGPNDMFVVKINSAPAFVYSTVFGGSGNDWLTGMTVDQAGSVYIAGYTQLNLPVSTPFPAFAAPNSAHFAGSGGFADGIVAKVTPGGRSLLYSMYVGGNGDDRCSAIAIDAAGNAYVSGYSDSTGTSFPTVNALPGGTTNQGATDAFVFKIGSYQVPSTSFVSPGDRLEFLTFGDNNSIDPANSPFVAPWDNAVAIAQRQSNGDIYQVVTGGLKVYARVFEANKQQWKNFVVGSGTTNGVPAVAVNETTGIGYIVFPSYKNDPADPVAYYWGKFDKTTGLQGGDFSPLATGGVFSTDPIITSCPNGDAYVIGKGYVRNLDDYQPLWMLRIDSSGTPGTWISANGQFRGKPSATCGSDNKVYVVARDRFDGVWAARISAGAWEPWNVAGSPLWIYTQGNQLSQDPQIVSDRKGNMYVVAATGTYNNLNWIQLQEGVVPVIPQNSWHYTGGQGTGLEYSASAINGDIFLAVRLPRTGTSTDEFFWWRSATQDPIGSFGAGWDHPLDRALNAIRSVAVAPK